MAHICSVHPSTGCATPLKPFTASDAVHCSAHLPQLHPVHGQDQKPVAQQTGRICKIQKMQKILIVCCLPNSAVPPSPPWGNGTFSTGPSPAPEIQVAAATPPLRPLAPPVRVTAPSPAPAALPPTWAGGAAAPTCPFPQPIGSPGGVPCGGQVPAAPPSPPLGNGTIPTGPSPVPEIPVAAATPPHTRAALASVVHPAL